MKEFCVWGQIVHRNHQGCPVKHGWDDPTSGHLSGEADFFCLFVVFSEPRNCTFFSHRDAWATHFLALGCALWVRPWSRRRISCRKLFSPQSFVIFGRSIEYVSKGIKKLLSFERFQGTNASHLWKRTIIFPTTLGRDMLVSRRISNESHVFSFLQVATDKIQLLCLRVRICESCVMFQVCQRFSSHWGHASKSGKLRFRGSLSAEEQDGTAESEVESNQGEVGTGEMKAFFFSVAQYKILLQLKALPLSLQKTSGSVFKV